MRVIFRDEALFILVLNNQTTFFHEENSTANFTAGLR